MSKSKPLLARESKSHSKSSTDKKPYQAPKLSYEGSMDKFVQQGFGSTFGGG